MFTYFGIKPFLRHFWLMYMLALQFSTIEPGYYDIGVYNTSSITSDILWYQLILHCEP